MIDLEIQPSHFTGDDSVAAEAARSLARQARAGNVHLGFPRYVEDVLKERWYEEGYESVMTFVDSDCNPIVVSRLNNADTHDDVDVPQQNRGVTYRFFIDGDTKDVVIPGQLTGGSKQLFSREKDYTFYALGSKSDFMAALEGGEKVDADLAWLYERLGQTLTSHVGPEGAVPYIASDRGVLGVRLDTFSE